MRMTRHTAYVAMLLGTVATPALADGVQGKDVTGTFTVGGGMFSYESTDDPTDVTRLALSGSGSIAIILGRELSTQIDIVGEQVTAGDADVEQYASMQGFGGHLTYRIENTGLVGLFGGYGSGSPTDEETWTGGWIGVEGQFWFDNITVAGQFAWLDISDHDGGDNEGLDEGTQFWRGVGRYFFTDDTKAEFDIAYLEAENVIDGDDDGDGVEWGLSIQSRLADAPLYGTLSFRSGHYDATTETDDADVRTASISLTYLFGTNSLKENDRNGASLSTPTMPLRAAGVFSELD